MYRLLVHETLISGSAFKMMHPLLGDTKVCVLFSFLCCEKGETGFIGEAGGGGIANTLQNHRLYNNLMYRLFGLGSCERRFKLI